MRYVLQHSGAKIAVVPGEFRGFDYPDMLGEIRASAPGLQHVIGVRCGERPGVLRFEDLVAGTGVPDPGLLGEPPSADAPHYVIYTSGTESRAPPRWRTTCWLTPGSPPPRSWPRRTAG